VSIIERALEGLDDGKPKGSKSRAKREAEALDTSAQFEDAADEAMYPNALDDAAMDALEASGGLDLPPLPDFLPDLESPSQRLAEQTAYDTSDALDLPTGSDSVSVATEPPQRVDATHASQSAVVQKAPAVLDAPAAQVEMPAPGAASPAPEVVSPLPSTDQSELGNDEPTVIRTPDASAAATTLSTQEARITSREVQLDMARLGAMGMLTPTAGNSALAEQYRAIKRPVLMQMEGDEAQRPANANLILLASALPNEGKTSTAINLAISMAQETDKTVLLVDGDVAKSDITKILGIEAAKGLTDLLAYPDLKVADVMLRTSVPKLSVIPAGQRMPNVTELFSGSDMRVFMNELAQRYSDRIVLIDSPPLLSTSGASVLASLAGQILLVVEAVRTPQRAVHEALRMLGPLDNIGVVLNKVRQSSSAYGYSYGYGYGYGDDA
jgi:protein-tyrosine kinase